ncbi:MAG TPA: hypothetical protein VF666_07715 [Pyrinomonadaceae bacterium]|jgi:hypothetical protein
MPKQQTFLLFALVILLLPLVSVACLDLSDGCGNELLGEAQAPGGKWKAVVFQRDCGATTSYSTQISILRIDEWLVNEGGNVFVVDTNHGQAPGGRGGDPVVEAIG